MLLSHCHLCVFCTAFSFNEPDRFITNLTTTAIFVRSRRIIWRKVVFDFIKFSQKMLIKCSISHDVVFLSIQHYVWNLLPSTDPYSYDVTNSKWPISLKLFNAFQGELLLLIPSWLVLLLVCKFHFHIPNNRGVWNNWGMDKCNKRYLGNNDIA